MNRQNYLNQLFNYAVDAYKQGDFVISEKTFRQILREFPGHPDAHHLLGISLSQQNKNDKAIPEIEKAIAINSRNPAYFNNLGRIYGQANQPDEAFQALAKALDIDPKFAEAYYNRANLRKSTGNTAGAYSDLEKLVEIDPGHHNGWYNLGNVHLEQGNFRTATECFEKAVNINPNFEAAHNNLGIVLQEWDRWEEALQHYQKAIEINPQYVEAQRNLALAYEAQGKTAQASACYDAMLKVEPNPGIQFHRDILCPVIHPSLESISNYRKNLERVLDNYQLQTDQITPENIDRFSLEPPSNLIYQGLDDRPIKEKFARIFQSLQVDRQFKKAASRIKVGFVVTSGHEGVFIKCMRGIISQLNRDDFDVSVICNLPNGAKILGPVFDRTSTTLIAVPKSIQSAAEMILSANFDILHFWEVGTDSLNYFLPFWRLAPVQCISWGWPITSGLPSIDYFLSTESLEPSGSEECYAEKLVCFKRLPVYYHHPPIPDELKPLSTFGFPEQAHIYLCNQNLRKVHPDFDVLVAGILEKDPSGIVAFINDKQLPVTNLLKSRLQKSCPASFSRIHFLERMPESDYLGLVKQVNVILDTVHYTGGANTTYDAFAAGTPVVTLPTQYHRGRYTLAAYQQIGITECIASSPEEYVEIACRLGRDENYAGEVGRRIQEASSGVFEDQLAVRELSDFFKKAISDSELVS